MIGLIAGWLVKRSLASGAGLTLPHARRIAKIGLILVSAAALIGGFMFWDWLDDRAAIRAHEADRVADTVAAQRRADTNDEIREDAREAVSEATTERLEEIHDEDPETATRPASRGSRAVAGRLRD